MGWRGEQGLIEHVFPVAGEFALGDDFRLERVRAAAVADDDDFGAGSDGGGRAPLKRSHAERTERQYQAKTGALVVGERVPLHYGAAVRGEPNRLGFGNEVADCQDQAVFPYHHAIAGAFGSQNRGGERVFRDFGAQQHYGIERRDEIELRFVRSWLQRRGERPVAGFGHAQTCSNGRPTYFSASMVAAAR